MAADIAYNRLLSPKCVGPDYRHITYSDEYRVSVAIMRHLSIISYNSKAVATLQLKFSVHKQLFIGTGCGYFNFFTTSSIL